MEMQSRPFPSVFLLLDLAEQVSSELPTVLGYWAQHTLLTKDKVALVDETERDGHVQAGSPCSRHCLEPGLSRQCLDLCPEAGHWPRGRPAEVLARTAPAALTVQSGTRLDDLLTLANLSVTLPRGRSAFWK